MNKFKIQKFVPLLHENLFVYTKVVINEFNVLEDEMEFQDQILTVKNIEFIIRSLTSAFKFLKNVEEIVVIHIIF